MTGIFLSPFSVDVTFFCGTEVDVIFLQEVASNFSDFFQRSSLAKDFKCVSPPSILVNPEGF